MPDDISKTSRATAVHPRVDHLMRKLGADISIGRRSRRMAAEDFAERIGCSRSTLHRLESGDANVSLHTFIMALHALGRLEALADITDARHDHITLSQMKADVPKRVTRRRPAKTEGTATPDAVGEKYVGF